MTDARPFSHLSATSHGRSGSAKDPDADHERMLRIFLNESGRNEQWSNKYLHQSLFLLGSGAFGSVFQVATRLYAQGAHFISAEKYALHPGFTDLANSFYGKNRDSKQRLNDRARSSTLMDVVAIKFEIIDQSHIHDHVTKEFLFLRREAIVLQSIWQQQNHRHLIGIPLIFDYGYLGDQAQYGIPEKFREELKYYNANGKEAMFFEDKANAGLTSSLTSISYMTMELVGPTIDDLRNYMQPLFAKSGVDPFFQVPTAFKLADQILCRLLVLHRSGFVHHDLKLDNIALGVGRASNTVYLLDFGFAKRVTNDRLKDWVGSRKYMSCDTKVSGRTNYGQDVESWFYILLVLLYDRLPWRDEVIANELGENADENAKWDFIVRKKESWWNERPQPDELDDYLNEISKLHCGTVPDIRKILDNLHAKTRELRFNLLSIGDCDTLQNKLHTPNSFILKGYFSIRKYMLQIFDIRSAKNVLLFDSELTTLTTARKEKKLENFPWNNSNYNWEWDECHQRMLGRMLENCKEDDGSKNKGEKGNENNSEWIMRLLRNTSAKGFSVGNDGKKKKNPDEVSYAYDGTIGRYLPLDRSWQEANREFWAASKKRSEELRRRQSK